MKKARAKSTKKIEKNQNAYELVVTEKINQSKLTMFEKVMIDDLVWENNIKIYEAHDYDVSPDFFILFERSTFYLLCDSKYIPKEVETIFNQCIIESQVLLDKLELVA